MNDNLSVVHLIYPDATFSRNSTDKSVQTLAINKKQYLPEKGNNLHFEVYTTPSFPSSGIKGSIASNNNDWGNGLPEVNGNEKPSARLYKTWEMEAGGSLLLDVSSNIRLKAGMQLNYANYVLEKESGLSNNGISDLPDQALMNGPSNITSVNGTTYRLAIPIGTELKLAGNGSIDWFAGATFQPSLLLSNQDIKPTEEINTEGISASVFRKWNFASTFETFLNYRISGHTSLKLGPQVRYQFMPSLIPTYNIPERLCQLGLKIGITGNF